ncbi:hypothetical protein R1sor_008458 [Riccia sorocarpa]|uniref:F-box domain-containing protein n=1 Tax=Riccia sorocarpa TaxID=122646 RepID=A0ABD3HWA8_9MARC
MEAKQANLSRHQQCGVSTSVVGVNRAVTSMSYAMELSETLRAEDGINDSALEFGDLPEGVIVSNILSRLTVRSILRLAATSKRWRAIIQEVELPPLTPWCIVAPTACDEDQELTPGFPLVYDVHERAWYEWALPSTFVSCSNGYILLEDDKDFVIQNPYKSTYERRVPKANVLLDEYDRCGTLSTILVEKEEVSAPRFRIIEQKKVWVNNWCVMEVAEASRFSLYDSTTDVWDTKREFKPRLCLRAGRPLKLKGSLYYLTKVRASSIAELQKNEFLYRLVACNLRTSRNHVILSRFPGRFQFVFLFEYHGRRMLFGAIWNSLSKDGERTLRTCVWQLNEKNMAWVEVMKLPRKIFSEFCRKTDPWEHAMDNDRFSDKTRCAASGEYLYGGLELHLFDPWLHVPLADIITFRKDPSVVFPFLSPGDPGPEASIRFRVMDVIDW